MAQTKSDQMFPIRLRYDRHGEDDGGVAAAAPVFVEPQTTEPVTRPAKDGPVDDGKAADPGDDTKPARHVPVEDLAKERERRRQAAADLQKATAELEQLRAEKAQRDDADKTELEKAQAAAERANSRAADAERRVITSEIRLAAAAAGFADPSDAVAFLGGDLGPYLTDGGVDGGAIEQAVAALLEKKPHLKRSDPTPAPKPRPTPAPAPDPSQGSRGGTPEVDFRTAPREDVERELAKHGIRI